MLCVIGLGEDAVKTESGFRDIANMIAEPRMLRSVMCSTGFEAIKKFNKLIVQGYHPV